MKTMLMMAVVLVGLGLAGCAQNPQCVQQREMHAAHTLHKAK